MKKLTTMEALIFFKKIPMFSELDIEQLLVLKDISEEKEYKAGDYIIKEGEYGNEAYIIVNGKVEILKNINNEEKVLTTMERSDYFGEMAIIEDEPRSASARAFTDSLLLVTNGNAFKDIIKHNAEISFNIVKVFSKRLRNQINKAS
ncbi:cyclic nucleotide-binding domain-containing protein [Spirochaetota bacterium]